jgi:putative chitinase
MPMKLEVDTLRRLWPRAPVTKITAIADISEGLFEEHGIDDVGVVVQLMANISHENGAGTIIRESGNYSADRLVQIFGSPHSSAAVTPDEAQALAHKPSAIFERVYNLPKSPKLARMLGNHEPGDGYKFRGGGDLQLTGRDSYTRIGHLTGHPEIVDNPDLMADPAISFTVAVAEFAALGCIKLCLQDKPLDVITTQVRRKVNGGTNGMSEVHVWVSRWAHALPDIEAPVEMPRGADTNNKTLMGSKIMKGVVSTGVTTAVASGSKIAESANTTSDTVDVSSIADHVQHAGDTITTIQTTVDSGKVLVQTVKPFLGVPPNLWATLAIVASIIAIGTLIYTGWQRWAKLRDQGV